MKLSYIKSNNILLKRIFLLILLFCGSHLTVLGQSSEDAVYQTENLGKKSFNKSKWASLNKELDYLESEPIYKPEKQPSARSAPFAINSVFVKSALLIVAIIILVFVIIKFFGSPHPNNKSISKANFSFENIEESIHEADLESFLKQAIQNNDYRQAIRLYYLITIRDLSNKKFIFWKKDKTNYEYLIEMKHRADFKSFKDLTDTFEIVWYSEKQFQENQYDSASKRFKEYIETLKSV